MKRGYLGQKVKRAIGALLSGEARTQREAAEIAGITEPHMSRVLHNDNVKQYIIDQVKSRISTVGLAAASRVMEALVETAESEYVRADLAKHILAVSGVKPERDATTTNVGSVKLIVNMGDNSVELAASNKPQTIDITPEPTAVLDAAKPESQ